MRSWSYVAGYPKSFARLFTASTSSASLLYPSTLSIRNMSTSDQVNLQIFQVLSTPLIELVEISCVEVYKSFTCERRGKKEYLKFSELRLMERSIIYHHFIQEWKAYSSSSQSPTSFSSWSSTPTCAQWSGLESVNNSLNSSSCLAVPCRLLHNPIFWIDNPIQIH